MDQLWNGQMDQNFGISMERDIERMDQQLNVLTAQKNGGLMENSYTGKTQATKHMNTQSKMATNEFGTKVWRFPNGDLHRVDGPALEFTSGTKQWFINGKRHREDGPAAEYSDGTKEWYINDVLHRSGGPAVEWGNGSKEWWIGGKFIYEENIND